MNTDKDVYILLKDLPDLKAGAEFDKETKTSSHRAKKGINIASRIKT